MDILCRAQIQGDPLEANSAVSGGRADHLSGGGPGGEPLCRAQQEEPSGRWHCAQVLPQWAALPGLPDPAIQNALTLVRALIFPPRVVDFDFVSDWWWSLSLAMATSGIGATECWCSCDSLFTGDFFFEWWHYNHSISILDSSWKHGCRIPRKLENFPLYIYIYISGFLVPAAFVMTDCTCSCNFFYE